MHYSLIDPNDPQHQRAVRRLRALRSRVVLWLLVAALVIALIPLNLVVGWVRADRILLEDDLGTMEMMIGDAGLSSLETLQLREEMTRTEGLITAIQAVVVPVSVDWPRVVTALTQYEPAELSLLSLQQQRNQIRITGRAVDNDAVVRYQQRLLEAGTFREVIITSLTLAPLPTPTGGTDPLVPTQPPGSVAFVIDLLVEDLVREVSAP
jgi:hypothetical protein